MINIKYSELLVWYIFQLLAKNIKVTQSHTVYPGIIYMVSAFEEIPMTEDRQCELTPDSRSSFGMENKLPKSKFELCYRNKHNVFYNLIMEGKNCAFVLRNIYYNNSHWDISVIQYLCVHYLYVSWFAFVAFSQVYLWVAKIYCSGMESFKFYQSYCMCQLM